MPHSYEKRRGCLNDEGDKVRFLGPTLQRQGNGILIGGDADYYADTRKAHDIAHCKEVANPSPQQVVHVVHSEDVVDDRRHSLYSKTVGKRQWRVPFIPDIAFKSSSGQTRLCLLYTSPSPRDLSTSRMPSSA